MRKIIFLISLLMATGAHAATYYVATNGLDSYTSTQAQNTNTPWKTIQKAATVAVAGDIVSIKGGTYREKGFLDVCNG